MSPKSDVACFMVKLNARLTSPSKNRRKPNRFPLDLTDSTMLGPSGMLGEGRIGSRGEDVVTEEFWS